MIEKVPNLFCRDVFLLHDFCPFALCSKKMMFYISSNIIHYLKYIVYFTVYSPLLSCFVSYLFCFSSSSFICTSPVLFSVCLLCKFCCYVRKGLPFVRMHVCVCVILVSLNPRLQCSSWSSSSSMCALSLKVLVSVLSLFIRIDTPVDCFLQLSVA